MSVTYNYFPNYGYIIADVPDELLVELRKIVSNKKLESFNKNLVGHIKKEFLIPEAVPLFQNFILYLCQEYEKEFNYLQSMIICTDSKPLTIDKMWVNFQEKYEFNPTHSHNGVFSFAIWLEVPFLIEEERKVSPGKNSNHDVSSCFQFSYTNILGSIISQSLEIDKKQEGKIAFFPARLNHSVNPFYSSDRYRVSVAGNVSLKT